LIPSLRRQDNPYWIYYRITGEDVTILHVRRAESLFHIEDLES